MPYSASPPSRAPDARDEVLTGRLLGGRYRVGAILGAGAMGCVYQAEHVDLGRSCAVKVIRPAAAGRAGKEVALGRFRIEALAGARLDHPNVLRVLDFGREPGDGLCYLVTEQLGGRDLADVLAAEKRLSPARAVRVGVALAAALQHAHDRGVVHRDLKPGNVRVLPGDDDGAGAGEVVKLLDFGTALIEGEQPGQGSVLGTPAYMSPEQLAGGVVDRRSDLFALGVVLFELVTGRLPFDGPSMVAIAAAHIKGAPPSPSAVAGPLDAELEAVILACLRRHPEDRPADARAVREALERVLARAEQGHHRPRPRRRRSLRSLPVPAEPRRLPPVAAIASAAAAITLWVAIFVEIGTTGSVEVITGRLGAAARRLPTPAAEVAPKAHYHPREVDAPATDVSWGAARDGGATP